MAPRIGVAVIHGMGSQDAKFARRFGAELVAALKREKAKPADVAIQPTWWADVVAPRESALLGRLNENKDLEWGRLRGFVVEALADAIAYQKTVKPPLSRPRRGTRKRASMSWSIRSSDRRCLPSPARSARTRRST